MRNRKGFTLVEIMVVVIIMGILASMSVPYYYKTIETTKAGDSVAIGHLLGNAYRMYRVDYTRTPEDVIGGQITNTCNSGACNTTATDGCRLVRCKYVSTQDWDNASYNFFGGEGACGTGVAACVRRKPGASAPYSGWGYDFTMNGACQEIPPMTNPNHPPSCPKF